MILPTHKIVPASVTHIADIIPTHMVLASTALSSPAPATSAQKSNYDARSDQHNMILGGVVGILTLLTLGIAIVQCRQHRTQRPDRSTSNDLDNSGAPGDIEVGSLRPAQSLPTHNSRSSSTIPPSTAQSYIGAAAVTCAPLSQQASKSMSTNSVSTDSVRTASENPIQSKSTNSDGSPALTVASTVASNSESAPASLKLSSSKSIGTAE